MTFPPPGGGGYDPQQPPQYSQPPGQPQQFGQPSDPYSQGAPGQPPYQPSDPYSQGYGSAPPPPGYGAPQQQYPQPGMTPPIGVQPGYPVGGPSPLPPQAPKQGNNLAVTLGVIVGLVLLLGIAAMLIVPGLLEDDENDGAGAGTATEEPSDDGEGSDDAPAEPTDEVSEEPADEPTEEPAGDSDWQEWISEDDADANSPEGVAMAFEAATDYGETDTMRDLTCANQSSAVDDQIEYYETSDPIEIDVSYDAVRRDSGGEIEVGISYDGPDEDEIYEIYTVVEESGEWKVCDFTRV